MGDEEKLVPYVFTEETKSIKYDLSSGYSYLVSR